MKLVKTAVPAGSFIHATLPGAHFADCYQMDDLWPDKDALQTYLHLVGRTPGWMNALMVMRNQAVRLVGLKHLGAMAAPDASRPASSYQLGQRVGIFSLLHRQANEAVLCDDDKHLRVEVSLVKHVVDGASKVSFSTVVHIHNRLGRAYMAVVGPAHSVIVPLMLAQVSHA